MAASLSSPFSCHHHHRRSHPNNIIPRSFNPKASSSLSATHSPLLRRVTSLCDRRDLARALSLLRDGGASGPAAKEALGVLLQACGREGDIETGRRVHAVVRSSPELGSDFVLNTRLITMYSHCGSPSDSRLVFDGLERNNLFMWNALLSAYTRNDLHGSAIEVFVELVSGTDFRPDFFTLPCVIKACSGVLDVGLGKVVHGMGVKMGLVRDSFVGNALVGFYGKCRVLEDAIKVFDRMPERNLVSWNSLIRGFIEIGGSRESYGLLNEVLSEGLLPDDATVVTLLPVCASEKNVDMGSAIHGLSVKLGLDEKIMVNNALMDMYLKCGYLREGGILFGRNGKKNMVSWNSMIGGFARQGDVSGTFDLLRRMQVDDKTVKVNEVTVLNALAACSEENELFRLKEIHGYSCRNGFYDDELVANAFVSSYSKCGLLSYAQSVFHSIATKTVSAWNALIGGLAQNGDPKLALDFYFQMKDSGINPDAVSIGSLLLACARLKSLQYGKQIHGFVLRNGLKSDSFIAISLISLYFNCNAISSAREIFYKMEDKSLVSWNTMLSGSVQIGLADEALHLFREMLFNGVRPYEISVSVACVACSQLSALRLGKELHCFALKSNLVDDMFVACSILDLYAKCGCMEHAQAVFDDLNEKDAASWNVLIAGYGLNGQGQKTLKLFEEMKQLGLKPDTFTFIGVLMACSHSGFVTEGLNHLKEMQFLHGIKPKLEHYACVIDMLGRSGRLEEAFELVKTMPEEPDGRIWSSLLSSCRLHKDFEMGEKISRKLLELEPTKAENYVLLSNLFAASGKWDDVKRVRMEMKDIGLQKDAGISWIDIDGKVYSFIAGDSSSPEIKEMWKTVEEKIRKIGYEPDTSCVLHELDEDEKIERLRGHSEKLAISLALLKTRRGSKIRVCKNLRICSDCHNAAKLVSKAVEREIVVRDNKRFHHFRDGVCSCSDYW